MNAHVTYGFNAPLAHGCVPDSLLAVLDVAVGPAGPRHGGAGERGDGARGVTSQPGRGLTFAGIDMGAILVY